MASRKRQKLSKLDVSHYNDIRIMHSALSLSSDGPRVVEHPGTVAGDLGDSVTLHCQVDSNPAPTYTWTRGASRQVSGQ